VDAKLEVNMSKHSRKLKKLNTPGKVESVATFNDILTRDDVSQAIQQLISMKPDLSQVLIIAKTRNDEYTSISSDPDAGSFLLILEAGRSIFIEEYFE
jgi:hypothetical protein